MRTCETCNATKTIDRSNLVLVVYNRHDASRGQPPALVASRPFTYHSYFENEFGEQAVFIFDYKRDEGKLYTGDGKWTKSVRIVDGETPDFVLTDGERHWLKACWQAVLSARELLRDENGTTSEPSGAGATVEARWHRA